MPADIRSFFGGKPAAPPAETPTSKESAKDTERKRGRSKRIVNEEDDDDEPAPKSKASTPKKQTRTKAVEPKVEATTADDFFANSSKPRRSEANVKQPDTGKTSARVSPKKGATGETNGTGSAPGSARSSRTRKQASYVELDEDDFPDDVDMNDSSSKYFNGSKKTSSGKGKKKAEEHDDDFEAVDVEASDPDEDTAMPDVDERIIEDKPSKVVGKKRKSTAALLDDDDDLEIAEIKPASKRSSPAKGSTANVASSKKQKKEDVQDSAEIKAIFDSIPTIRAPSPPRKDGNDDRKPKFQFGGQHANSAEPSGAMNPSDYPVGEENCLAGLTFVFTGQLQRLGREQGQNIVKQYGGKVTSAPSKKTSYVVLGEEAGPKKLATIRDHKLKVINEDGLFELIKRLPANGGDSAAAAKMAEKRAAEDEKIRKDAEDESKKERARLAAAAAKAKSTAATTGQPSRAPQTAPTTTADGKDTRLWTVRYAPTELHQICGNKAQVDKLQRWLRNFPKNLKAGFKMAGADGSGSHRAVMIHGPPGIGKTTAAHLVAKLEGYDIVESNASDTRSKKLVESGLKGVLSTTSLMGYFGAGDQAAQEGKKKLVLIMDEVDGMSAGDRGGVGALAAVCKKTQVPMILICNDRKLPKMKPFDFCTYDLAFRRPTADQISSRLATIAYREKMNIPRNVINALIEGSGADIRQVVNMLSTAKLDQQNLTFEESKDMSKAWEKHIILKPWDMVSKILGGNMFNPVNGKTLNDKQELYFNDHEFAPLMLQENYLGTKPQRCSQHQDNDKIRMVRNLDLVAKAADAISDGDLVDRMIHGSQQQWGLMPVHAMFSFVRPASFVHGSMAGHQTRFTAWLGKNSNQGKLMRLVKEIQAHMRLRISGDRYEVRQTYMPLLFDRLVRRLQVEGNSSVPEIIELMDHYFLTKEDWDAILELGVGEHDAETVKIESKDKAAFTRLYNQQAHPMPFMKASEVGAPKKGAAAKEKPDLEDALEQSDEGEVIEEDAKDDDDDIGDISKDKYVKQPKKKAAPKSKSKTAAAAADGDEDEKPKKGAAKGKGRAKK